MMVQIIPISEQIQAANRLIDDMKTVAAMLDGESKAQRDAIFDLNCLVAIRETLITLYVPEEQPFSREAFDNSNGPVIYGRDTIYPKRVPQAAVIAAANDHGRIVPRPNKHRV